LSNLKEFLLISFKVTHSLPINWFLSAIQENLNDNNLQVTRSSYLVSTGAIFSTRKPVEECLCPPASTQPTYFHPDCKVKKEWSRTSKEERGL